MSDELFAALRRVTMRVINRLLLAFGIVLSIREAGRDPWFERLGSEVRRA